MCNDNFTTLYHVYNSHLSPEYYECLRVQAMGMSHSTSFYGYMLFS